MSHTTTIIYYTDNAMDENLQLFCQRNILEAAEGKPIISISQKPIDFGTIRICLGDIGRSHVNMFKQILAGVEQATTQYIALAEHDCLYTKEHFSWTPPSEVKFYYNLNHWFVTVSNGLYSWYRRKVLSQMIANREMTLRAAEEKVRILSSGVDIQKGQAGACEFGVINPRKSYANLQVYLNSLKDFGKELEDFKAASFVTTIPNIDIRHGKNWSGGRRGTKPCMEIPYWGTFKSVMEGKWPVQ